MSLTKKPTYNHLYIALKDQLVTESAIFREKGDIYSEALTLTFPDSYSRAYLRTSTQSLINQVEQTIDESNSLNHFKEVVLVYHLSSAYLRPSSKLKSYIESKAEDIAKSKISPQVLGTVNYYLKDHGTMIDKYDLIKSSLTNKLDEFVKNGNFNAAIDISMGLSQLDPKAISWINQELPNRLHALSIERVAKAAILLPENTRIISRLEDMLLESLGNWLQPEISFSIIEAQKIISSNIPSGPMSKVLEELKRSDTKWARMISAIEDEGITIDMSQLQRLPNFSPNQDIWSLRALKDTGRAKTLQISPTEYNEFNLYKKRSGEGFKNLDVLSVFMVIFLAVYFTAYSYFLLIHSRTNLLDSIKNISLSNTILDIYGPYFALTNAWIATVVNATWLILLFARLLNDGLLDLKSFILSWPLLYPFEALIKYLGGRLGVKTHGH